MASDIQNDGGSSRFHKNRVAGVVAHSPLIWHTGHVRAKSSHLTPPAIFGRRVGEIRRVRGLSQAELAKRIGVDRTTLNKIENGSRADVSISQLFAFAEALGVAPVHLLTPRRLDSEI